MNENIQHVSQISKKMKNVCTAIMVIIPIGHILIWTNIETARGLGFLQRISLNPENITTTNLLAGFFVSGMLAAVAFMAIYHLRKFFSSNSKGETFTVDSSFALHRFSKYLIYYSILTIPVDSALSVIMSMGNPVGERILSITFQTHDLMLIFLGFVIFTISWVMKESVRIAEENAQII